MRKSRRGFLTTLLAGAAALGLPVTVAKAETVLGCADCTRLFSATFPLPGGFDRQAPPGMVQRAVHELAVREGISHDEVCVGAWLDALPPLVAKTEAKGYTQAPGVVTRTGPSWQVFTLADPVADRPTFALMQQDCNAMGHQLFREEGGWEFVVTHESYGRGTTLCSDHLSAVNEWRRWMYESGA